MTFIDWFSGIGGFHAGLELAGHKCVGWCEFDVFAQKSYRAMHNVEGVWFSNDITKTDYREIPRADVWCAGTPCQDISVAGKQHGLRGKRSGLFFILMELLKKQRQEDKPRYIFLENVKNLLSINGGWDFGTYLAELDACGYDAEWQLLNSKDYGVPQNRERVFIIGHLRGTSGRKVFPITGQSNGYTTVGKSTETTIARALQVAGHSGGNHSGMTILSDSGQGRKWREQDFVSALRVGGDVQCVQPVLTPDRAEKRQNGRRFKEDGEPMFTLTGQDRHGVAIIENFYQSREPRVYTEEPPTLRARQGLLVREATKQGYDIAFEGDSINLAVPGSQTRRGRVGKGVANTLDTSCNQGVLIPTKEVEDKERGTEEERNTIEILQALRREVGEKVFAEWGIDVIASLQQDGLLQQGVYEKRFLENREEQSNKWECPNDSKRDKSSDATIKHLPRMWEDWKIRYSSQGRKLPEQLNRKLDEFVSELPYENAQSKEVLYCLWKASEGIGVLQQALHKIQKVWEPKLYKIQNCRIRRLLPIECFRLQGFSDEYFEKARQVNSDSQLYKQAGNSVSVPVIYAIAQRL